MSQSWKDYRLQLPENMTSKYRLLPLSWLKKMWRPDSFFKNAKKVTFQEMTIPNHYIWLYSDKTILYMVKLTLELSCAMKFEAYPHDTQTCSLKMESCNFTCIEVMFTLERRLGYYLFHTYIPTCLIVIMSWISFWIRADAVPARVTLCVTSLLTLATQHAQSQKSLPPVSYIKAIDIFMSTCTLFVFSSLMEYAIVNIVIGQAEEREKMANTLMNEAQMIQIENRGIALNYSTFTGTGMNWPPYSPDLTPCDYFLCGALKDTVFWNNPAALDELEELISEAYASISVNTQQWSQTRTHNGMRVVRSPSLRRRSEILERQALKIDKVSRIVFPALFIILNVAYWSYYLR
ncbi:Glycine receptor subunit alpha-3 [Araneus ventricosus]|uniref:Glycine receptor subunit alpha-3 n=1 Tax=Araneus ventricosus TaxID=182803 RepID=A0A4Y2GGV7_ARAVE|nr:Glycine receptor subunit alpha-3 [Araneus ventricosus]